MFVFVEFNMFVEIIVGEIIVKSTYEKFSPVSLKRTLKCPRAVRYDVQ